ncbi:hypothetical protein [Sphingobium cloacae]|uniref:Uncharacterized protein n=2 Tax=Sphingobium cloacae TaxID=120107 RepID=A0A1E1F1M8_9SPHN|nr:hypothetical protein [Sphingobium cloacae]BAV64372.1 hypothetical protein SCLO_1013320 [Sphingobium cloacae]
MLDQLGRRVDCEISYMIEEIAEIDRFAQRLVEDGFDQDERISGARERVASARTGTFLAQNLRHEYDRAGELLSLCLDMAIGAGEQYTGPAEALLARRVEPEMELLGSFHIVGKS